MKCAHQHINCSTHNSVTVSARAPNTTLLIELTTEARPLSHNKGSIKKREVLVNFKITLFSQTHKNAYHGKLINSSRL